MLIDMDEEILQQAGLTKSEARTYATLVKSSPATPPKLAELAHESRSNTYKLLDSLEAKGLVSRDDTQPKLRYWANNPSNLLENLKQARQEAELSEKRLQENLPAMMNEYFQHSDQPSVHYFQGVDGVIKIFKDQLAAGKPVTTIHSRALVQALNRQESHLLRNEFPKRDIHQHVFYADFDPLFAPDEPLMPIAESDKLMKIRRTWLDESDLKEPVEWAVYGNKLSIVSLGVELVGMVIESPQITASFREILALLDRKVRAEPGYDKLPIKRKYTMVPESAKPSRR